jgi:hypothetical protein
VEFWARRGDLAREQFVVTQGTSALDHRLHIGFRANDTFLFAFYGDDLSGPAVSDTTTWRHYACTYDASDNSRVVYIDGREVARDTATGDFSGTGTLDISGNVSALYSGQLDELRIWTRALNSAEVQKNMRKKLIGNEGDLVQRRFECVWASCRWHVTQ